MENTTSTSPTSNLHSAFFYGTLMAPQVLHRVCHGPLLRNNTHSLANTSSPLIMSPALLPGFRRHRVLNADYPAVVPCEASWVRGTLVRGLNDGDMFRLDVFEGVEYERRKVRVRVPMLPSRDAAAETGRSDATMTMQTMEREDDAAVGEEIDAETYVWIAGKQYLEEKEWDFDEFVREKMWRWVGSDGEVEGEYNELDDAVKEEQKYDPTGGRGLNRAISKTLDE